MPGASTGTQEPIGYLAWLSGNLDAIDRTLARHRYGIYIGTQDLKHGQRVQSVGFRQES